ncbi:hypothetical protein T492DRAFT_1112987 [Pavlovales sp. CCMP2436]|nr:hypothetical protein T492DRAFT_1112987 [Pavlovales sp. CCMP2436]
MPVSGAPGSEAPPDGSTQPSGYNTITAARGAGPLRIPLANLTICMTNMPTHRARTLVLRLGQLLLVALGDTRLYERKPRLRRLVTLGAEHEAGAGLSERGGVIADLARDLLIAKMTCRNWHALLKQMNRREPRGHVVLVRGVRLARQPRSYMDDANRLQQLMRPSMCFVAVPSRSFVKFALHACRVVTWTMPIAFSS